MSLKGFNEIHPELTKTTQNLHWLRTPCVEERAPEESWFDTLVNTLKDEPASTQCIFSCQQGRGRTSLGMIVACLIKEIKVN